MRKLEVNAPASDWTLSTSSRSNMGSPRDSLASESTSFCGASLPSSARASSTLSSGRKGSTRIRRTSNVPRMSGRSSVRRVGLPSSSTVRALPTSRNAGGSGGAERAGEQCRAVGVAPL